MCFCSGDLSVFPAVPREQGHEEERRERVTVGGGRTREPVLLSHVPYTQCMTATVSGLGAVWATNLDSTADSIRVLEGVETQLLDLSALSRQKDLPTQSLDVRSWMSLSHVIGWDALLFLLHFFLYAGRLLHVHDRSNRGLYLDIKDGRIRSARASYQPWTHRESDILCSHNIALLSRKLEVLLRCSTLYQGDVIFHVLCEESLKSKGRSI